MALDLWKKFEQGDLGSPAAIASAQDRDEQERLTEFRKEFELTTAARSRETAGDFRHVPMGGSRDFNFD